MNAAEIQRFKQIGIHLRNTRELRGLTLHSIANHSGLPIVELVRIERGEVLGFKQKITDTLSNAEVYAKALEVDLQDLNSPHSKQSKIHTEADNVYIPVFLRKK